MHIYIKNKLYLLDSPNEKAAARAALARTGELVTTILTGVPGADTEAYTEFSLLAARREVSLEDIEAVEREILEAYADTAEAYARLRVQVRTALVAAHVGSTRTAAAMLNLACETEQDLLDQQGMCERIAQRFGLEL